MATAEEARGSEATPLPQDENAGEWLIETLEICEQWLAAYRALE